MKIVVTGALGHIGSQLIRTLPDHFPAIDLHLIDNLSTSRYSSVFSLPEQVRYSLHVEDIRTCPLAERFEGAKVVIHLAAATDATLSFKRRQEVEDVNIEGSLLVANACLEAGSSLLFPSTTSVYGSQTSRVDEDCPRSELRPQSPYADGKLRIEEELSRLKENGLKYTTCRFGTIFGPSPGMRFHTAVNKFCWQASLGQPLTVWKTALHQVRPYLDLEDCTGVIAFLIQNQLFDGNLYNVVTQNASVNEVIELIRTHVENIEIRSVDVEIMNQLSYEVSADKIAGTGFRPVGSLLAGIRKTMIMLSGLASSGSHTVGLSHPQDQSPQ